MDIRQVALAANGLDGARHNLFKLSGIDAGFQDPGIAEFGLRTVYFDSLEREALRLAAALHLERRDHATVVCGTRLRFS